MIFLKSLRSINYAGHIRIMRVDHWIKNVFMFPGTALAIAFELPTKDRIQVAGIITSVVVGFIALCLLSSANYVINEFLDRDNDRIHPMKRHRAAIHYEFSKWSITLQYAALLSIALVCSVMLSRSVTASMVMLAVMGILYNVRPIRFKDHHYLDVVSESVNNPLRLAIGWFCVMPNTIVPASAFLSFWGLGIFLMSLKRYSEMMMIDDLNLLHTYRRSFVKWSPEKLLVFAFVGAITSALFSGVLLGRRNLDYVLLFPSFLLIYAEYFKISLALDPASYAPERLMKKSRLKMLGVTNFVLFVAISFSDSRILTEWIPIAHF